MALRPTLTGTVIWRRRLRMSDVFRGFAETYYYTPFLDY